MPQAQQISRRTWLAQVALGSFAIWNELNFGLGRKGWSIAIGGRDLASGVAHAQNLGPAHPDHMGSIGEVLAAAPKATAYAGAADIPQIKSPRPLKAVGDNDEVFGLRVIATPGHTPGHVCVFDPAGSLLILGDAMNNTGNKLAGPNPQYSADMAQAHESVKKLAKLTFQRAVFGHGKPIDKGASQAIAKLAGTL